MAEQLALALEADDGAAAPVPGLRLELDAAVGSTVLADGRRVWWRQYPICLDTGWRGWAPGPIGRVEFSGV
jgi:hypothetical protein